MIKIQYPELDLSVIARSGQCFRFFQSGEHEYLLFAKDLALKIIEEKPFYTFLCSEEEYHSFWKAYFDLDTDYTPLLSVVSSSDKILKKALLYGKGLRILRQDPWEMLITFILSQRKNIPSIMTCVRKICEQFGEQKSCSFLPNGYYTFPSAAKMSMQSEEKLRSCGLGYRAPYVKAAAQLINSQSISLSEMEKMDDELLQKTLRTIPGVGPKISQCVMLFGFHRMQAFPIDVWINRAMHIWYQDHFPYDQYPQSLGILQQFLFFYIRETYPRTHLDDIQSFDLS